MYDNAFFDAEYLEPKCPRCGLVLDYGINTHFIAAQGAHVCTCCGESL